MVARGAAVLVLQEESSIDHRSQKRHDSPNRINSKLFASRDARQSKRRIALLRQYRGEPL
eukprot:COSAG02_NODE_43274_length_376_cov_0.924188_1_plen_59_part_01